MAYSISGTVYTDQGITPMGSGRTVAVSINGAAAAATTTTDANGNFTLSGLITGAAVGITVYLQGNTEVGVSYFIGPTSNSTNITDLRVYQDHLVLVRPTGSISGTITASGVYSADNNGATGISAIFSAASPNITLASGKSLYVGSGVTVSLSGVTVTIPGSLKSDATGTMAAGTWLFTGSGSINLAGAITGVLTVDAGAAITATTNITANSSVTINATGAFDLNGRTLSVGSDWTNSGTFTHSNGSVTFTGTSSNTIAGSTTFYNLTKTVTSGARSITFTDGTTQTVENSLTLQGISGNLLTLQGSGSAGWTIAVPATQTLSYLSVSRSTATGNTAAAGSTSTDGGNNVNWTFGAQASIPSKTTLVHGLGL